MECLRRPNTPIQRSRGTQVTAHLPRSSFAISDHLFPSVAWAVRIAWSSSA